MDTRRTISRWWLWAVILFAAIPLSCKGTTVQTNGDQDRDVVADQDPESLEDVDPLELDRTEQIDGVEDQDKDPSDQGEQLEGDQVDQPEDPSDQVEDQEGSEQETAGGLWLFFEGLVAGGGHTASPGYQILYGRIAGLPKGVAQSPNYRIIGGAVSPQSR